MAATFIQSKEVLRVQKGMGEESVPQYKQIQGYMVPEHQTYSHVCV